MRAETLVPEHRNQRFLCIFDAVFSHLKNALAIRQIWGVDQFSYSSTFLASTQVDSEGTVMTYNVTTNRFCWVTEKSVWPCHHLVCHINAQVVHVCYLSQNMHVLVQFLLTLC